MAEKPFPFNVCKECCNGGGGSNTDDIPENEHGSSSSRILFATPLDDNGNPNPKFKYPDDHSNPELAGKPYNKKYYLKRAGGGDGDVGIVTLLNRDLKVQRGDIEENSNFYKNYIDHDEPYLPNATYGPEYDFRYSLAFHDQWGNIVAEPGTRPFHVVVKKQLDAVMDWEVLADVTLDNNTGNTNCVYIALDPQKLIDSTELYFYFEFKAVKKYSAGEIPFYASLTDKGMQYYNFAIAVGGNNKEISLGGTVRSYATIHKQKNVLTTLFAPITPHVESSSKQNIETMVSIVGEEKVFVTRPVHLRISGATFPKDTKILLLGRK